MLASVLAAAVLTLALASPAQAGWAWVLWFVVSADSWVPVGAHEVKADCEKGAARRGEERARRQRPPAAYICLPSDVEPMQAGSSLIEA